MAVATTTLLTGAALAATSAATYNSYASSKSAAKRAQAQAADQLFYQHRAIELQKEQEKLRKKQMNQEAANQQRANIRQAQIARAMSVNRAGASGALLGSGVQGAIGGIYGQQGVQGASIYSNTLAGNQMFDLNSQLSDVNLAAAQSASFYNQRQAAAQSSAAMWSGIGQLAGSVVGNYGTASNVFQSLFGTTSGWEATVTRT